MGYDRSFNIWAHPVRVRILGFRKLVDHSIGSVELELAADSTERLPALPDDLARLAHTAQFPGQSERAQFRSITDMPPRQLPASRLYGANYADLFKTPADELMGLSIRPGRESNVLKHAWLQSAVRGPSSKVRSHVANQTASSPATMWFELNSPGTWYFGLKQALSLSGSFCHIGA